MQGYDSKFDDMKYLKPRSLHDMPSGTWVRVVEDEDVRVPPGAPVIRTGQRVFFDHIDGMYSYCKDEDGNVIHLAAWTDVVFDDPHDAKAKDMGVSR